MIATAVAARWQPWWRHDSAEQNESCSPWPSASACTTVTVREAGV